MWTLAIRVRMRIICIFSTLTLISMNQATTRPSTRWPVARALSVGLVCTLTIAAPALAAKPAKKKPSQAEAASNAELAQRLAALAAQNQLLLEKVERLEAAQVQLSTQLQQQAHQLQEQANQAKQPAQAVEPMQEAVAATSNTGTVSTAASATVVSSYGEIGYSRPTHSAKDTSVDVQRAVIGVQHRFDDQTKMISEFEWEHAITSSSDGGEAEVEQLWVEREFKADLRGRAGLFLMPVGLINQNHEPTAYYGVFRPDVDTKIIPSTWREVGIGLAGDIWNGLNWDVALTTAPNLTKWDPASTEGRDRGPLQAIHGEGQFAAARDLGLVAALNWRTPGLLLGGAVVYDSIGQHQPEFQANGAKLLLLDLHGRYQIAGWDFAGELVRGTISNIDALNTSFINSPTANPTLVPHLFYGGYVQAAYTLWSSGDYTLSPFARYEILNTGADYGALAVASQPTERVKTLGANLMIGEGVVLKADYRAYRQNKQPDAVNHFNLGSSLNVGVGYSF